MVGLQHPTQQSTSGFLIKVLHTQVTKLYSAAKNWYKRQSTMIPPTPMIASVAGSVGKGSPIFFSLSRCSTSACPSQPRLDLARPSFFGVSPSLMFVRRGARGCGVGVAWPWVRDHTDAQEPTPLLASFCSSILKNATIQPGSSFTRKGRMAERASHERESNSSSSSQRYSTPRTTRPLPPPYLRPHHIKPPCSPHTIRPSRPRCQA